jgi:type IV secretion system protein TrbG
MIRFISAASALSLAAACSTVPPRPQTLMPADFTAAISVAEPAPPAASIAPPLAAPQPGQIKPLERSTPSPPSVKPLTPAKAVEAGRSRALVEPSADGFINAIQVYPYTEGALYRLYASPGQVSDIALEPGEALVSVSAGDTVRWIVGDTSSGAGETTRVHVLVKPVDIGVRTNLMIATDRRTYHLELESVKSAYMAALSWRYSQDELNALTKSERASPDGRTLTTASGVDLAALNFDYRLSGGKPDCTPVRVFDDGRRVFIQMPDSVTTTDLPPLFVRGEGGKAELVNYRVRNNTYIVDQLFDAAELRLGTKPQTVVRITRRAPKARG